MASTAPSGVPQTRDEWIEAGREAFEAFLEAIARYGVRPDPRLQLIPGELPNPYYEPESCSIALGMPDPATVKGRLYWLAAARLYGLGSVEEAMAAVYEGLPWVIAHETAHHLRHAYSAPNENDFVEEQVCNLIAIAFVREHPNYRDTLEPMREFAERAAARLRELAPDAVGFLPGYRLDLADVLTAEGKLATSEASEIRRLATLVGIDETELLAGTGRMTAEEVSEAAARRVETEAFFNQRYTSSLYEYFLFGNDWLRIYLAREDLPGLGEALSRYVLTPDWEKTRREEVRLLLESSLHHPDAGIAVAAAEALAADFASAAAAPIGAALEAADPARQAGLLRVLSGLDAGLASASALRLLDASDPDLRATAAAVAAADGSPSAETVLRDVLRTEGPAREAALATLAALASPRFLHVFLACVRAEAPSLRALALQALARLPRQPALGVVAARALSDPEDAVRWRALEAIERHGDESVAADLWQALDDPAAPIRAEAGRILRERAFPMPVAGDSCSASWELRSEAALVTRDAGDPAAVHGLLDEIVAASAELRCLATTLRDDSGRSTLLRDALAEEHDRLLRIGLSLGGALGDTERMERALGALEAAPEARAEALRLAASALPHEVAERMAPLMGNGSVPPDSPAPDPDALLSYPRPLLRELAAEYLTLCGPPGEATPFQDDGMLTTIERLMLLRAVPLFAGIALDDLRPLADACIAVRYRAGEMLFEVGDSGDTLFVVTSGRVAILHGKGDQALQVASLGAGQCFGEMALFDGGPRSASARAIEDLTVLALRRQPFLRLGRRQPELLLAVIRLLSARLRDSLERGGGQPDG